MLNILWPIFIIISFLYALLTGNTEIVNNSIFNSVNEAVNLSIKLVGTTCFWTGMIKIMEKTTIVSKILNLLKPIINFLFPEEKNNNQLKKQISMNIIANMLGLGNAATPLGIKAMETMQIQNNKKKVLTNSMAMFIVINTASLQIIPTTVISIRNSLNSSAPTNIIFPVWIATIAAAVAGVMSTKFFIKLEKK